MSSFDSYGAGGCADSASPQWDARFDGLPHDFGLNVLSASLSVCEFDVFLSVFCVENLKSQTGLSNCPFRSFHVGIDSNSFPVAVHRNRFGISRQGYTGDFLADSTHHRRYVSYFGMVGMVTL